MSGHVGKRIKRRKPIGAKEGPTRRQADALKEQRRRYDPWFRR